MKAISPFLQSCLMARGESVLRTHRYQGACADFSLRNEDLPTMTKRFAAALTAVIVNLGAHAQTAPLRLANSVTDRLYRRLDHFAVDSKHNRLRLVAQDHGTLVAFDLKTGDVVTRAATTSRERPLRSHPIRQGSCQIQSKHTAIHDAHRKMGMAFMYRTP